MNKDVKKYDEHELSQERRKHKKIGLAKMK